MSNQHPQQWFQQLTERENRKDSGSADADAHETPHEPESSSHARIRRGIRRAALRWLVDELAPTGAAQDVVTRISRVRADIAAFWSRPVRNSESEGPGRILDPHHTLIIECFSHREQCWPDCADSARAAPQLVELRHRQAELESDIRREEPHLRDSSSLFEEFAEWHYDRTNNAEYRRLRAEVEALEHALYAGTRFERIREAALADELYLAVPADLVEPEELADGWGLLWVHQDMSVEIKRKAMVRDCLPDNRFHLVQNIAAAGLGNTLFAAGIRSAGDRTVFVRPPRGHRNPEQPQLLPSATPNTTD